jgi:hypothetical protein
VLTLIVACAALLLVFHLVGRWVRARCDEVDFGLFGPRESARHPSS